MSPESERQHGAAEDERARVNRERRIRAKATAEADARAKRNLLALLPYGEPIEDVDFPGSVL